MARSSLTAAGTDLTTDGGAVLWSIIRGEQLEFPVVLSFIKDAPFQGQNPCSFYTLEAVVIEALNKVGQGSNPSEVQPGGIQDVLSIRIPPYKGTHNLASTYQRGEVVLSNGLYYELLGGPNYSNAVAPETDDMWMLTTLNRIYLQFPETLGANYSVIPVIGTHTYGFFELRVTEPTGGVYQSTWKPVRGMLEFLFSPTDVVP